MYQRVVLVSALSAASVLGSVALAAPQAIDARAGSRTLPGGAIAGQVLADATGTPIEDAQVKAVSRESLAQIATSTDARGQYTLSPLAPGTYTVSVTRDGYLRAASGQDSPASPSGPIVVRAGETANAVNFRLLRPGVIAGHVFRENGEPVSSVQVVAMRLQFLGTNRAFRPLPYASVTNDLGEYRLFGLPPGDYYISATFKGPRTTTAKPIFVPTYYPGTSKAALAKSIHVRPADALTNVDLALISQLTGTIVGTAPAGVSATVSVASADGLAILDVANVRPDGSFEVNGLPPGDYVVKSVPRRTDPYAGNYSLTAAVTIAGGDRVPVALVAQTPGRLTGRVIVATNARSRPPMNMVRVRAVPENSGGEWAPLDRDPLAEPDGTFAIDVAPGALAVTAVVPISGWAVRAVRQHGSDITNSTVVVRPGASEDDVEIELTDVQQRIRGTVVDASARRLGDQRVLVFPADDSLWSHYDRYVSYVTTTSDGAFTSQSVPPGEYCATVVDETDPAILHSPDFLAAARKAATRVELKEGADSMATLVKEGMGR